MMYGRGFGWSDMMGGWGWVGGLIMLAFWILIATGVVLFVMWVVRTTTGTGHGHQYTGPGNQAYLGQPQPPQAPQMHPQAGVQSPAPPTHDEAVAIARRRFASGEISKDEFDELMKTLGG